jgi:hypothetical protein
METQTLPGISARRLDSPQAPRAQVELAGFSASPEMPDNRHTVNRSTDRGELD